MRGLYTITCAVFIFALLVIANNLLFATNWNLAVLLLYFTLPFDTACEYSVTFVALGLVWAVMIGITIITAMDNTIMGQACDQYGCAVSWTFNVILHYIPPILLTLHILCYKGVRRLHQFLVEEKILVALVVLLVLALEYCFFMDPVSRYYLKMRIPTFLSILLAGASGVLAAVVCLSLFLAARRATGRPTDADERSPLLSKTAVASIPFPGLEWDLPLKSPPWPPPTAQEPAPHLQGQGMTPRQYR